MNRFEVRPRFELRLAVSSEVMQAALEDATAQDGRSWARMPYAEFAVADDQRHMWSPRLAVCVHEPADDDPDPQLRLCCRFQPEPDVWTFYMAMAGALVVSACVAVAWICASWILGRDLLPPIIALGVASSLGGALYAASQFGQRMATHQMGGLAERLWLASCDAKARAHDHLPLREPVEGRVEMPCRPR